MPPRRRKTPIGDDLLIERRSVDELLPDPANVRLHGERNLAAIRASLRQFGQRKPIVILDNNIVVAGNGTLEAAKAEGMTDIAVVVFPGTAEQARAYAIADNRTGELAEWDEPALLDIIGSLDADMQLAVGFAPDDIEDLIASVQANYPDADSIGAMEASPHDEAVPPIYSEEMILAEAMAHYRERGFPYPRLSILECLQRINRLAQTPVDSLRNSTIGYHVPDRWHPERFTTKIPGKATAVEQFDKDERLMQAFQLILAGGDLITDTSLLNALGRVRGAQTAAQFRPGFALWYVRRFCPDGGRWLDTSAGWGGRLVAYAASSCEHYIGIDPSSTAVAANRAMIEQLGITGAKLIQKPAEDVKITELGGSNSFDFALTSPPYFSKEHYSDEPTQSFARYETGAEWRAGFLVPMIGLQFRALKPGAYSMINIADVTIKSETYPLVEWTIADALAAGFEHVGSESFPMPRVPGTGARPEASEPCIVLRKPE